MNYFHDRDYGQAINTDASSYIKDPVIVEYIINMAEKVRATGLPHEFETYIIPFGRHPMPMLCRMRIEKFTDTDLILTSFIF